MILMTEVLEHLERPQEALVECSPARARRPSDCHDAVFLATP